jgi:hypothetical protein
LGNLKERDQLGDAGVNGRVIKKSLKNYDVTVWIALISQTSMSNDKALRP